MTTFEASVLETFVREDRERADRAITVHEDALRGLFHDHHPKESDVQIARHIVPIMLTQLRQALDQIERFDVDGDLETMSTWELGHLVHNLYDARIHLTDPYGC